MLSILSFVTLSYVRSLWYVLPYDYPHPPLIFPLFPAYTGQCLHPGKDWLTLPDEGTYVMKQVISNK